MRTPRRRTGRRRLGPAVLVGIVVAIAACGSDSGAPSDFTVPGGGRPGAFTEADVVVGSEPFLLDGTLRTPTGASADAPVPGAVILGDFGPQDQDGTVLGRKPLRDLAEGLADRGVATLTYDKRATAHPDEVGVDATVGLDRLVLEDARSALDVLASSEGVDAEELFVVGHGFGGTVAPLVAGGVEGVEGGEGGDAVAVAGLVELVPPARPLHQVVRDQTQVEASADDDVDEDEQALLDATIAAADRIDAGDIEGDIQAGELLGAPGAFWRDLRDYKPVTAARESGLPVLVVLAGRDYAVAGPEADRWRQGAEEEAVGGGSLTVETLETLDHLLAAGEGPSTYDDYAAADRVDAELLDLVADWIHLQIA